MLYLACFNHSLLTVSKLTTELNCYVTIFGKNCYFSGPLKWEGLGISKEDYELYVFQPFFQLDSKIIPEFVALVSSKNNDL